MDKHILVFSGVVFALLLVVACVPAPPHSCDQDVIIEHAHRELCAATLPQSAKACKTAPYNRVVHLIEGKTVDLYLDGYVKATRKARGCQ